MPTRTRPPARRGSSRRVLPPPKRKRRLDPKAAAERASRLPHHPRYTAALLAQVRRRFEETPEPIRSMAADLGVAPGSLHRIARRHRWVRRKPAPPARDVPPAMRLLEEAMALEAGAHAAGGVADEGEAAPPVTLPLVGRVARAEARAGWGSQSPNANATTPTPDPSPPLPRVEPGVAGGGKTAPPVQDETESVASPGLSSTIERLERAVLAELATIEAMRAALGTLPQKPPGAARTVRTLGMLTQTLQHLQRLRAGEALAAKPPARNDTGNDHGDDDDMPQDIDEFRRDLARRIDAFVASRPQSGDAGGDPGAATVDETE